MAASESGVDIIDVAMDSFSGALPNHVLGRLCAANDTECDTGIDPAVVEG